jgi:hypothetical protein
MKKTLQRLGMVTVGLSLCLWSCKEQDGLLKPSEEVTSTTPKIKEKIDFSVVEGRLKFETMEDFKGAIAKMNIPQEMKELEENGGFTSMNEAYKEFVSQDEEGSKLSERDISREYDDVVIVKNDKTGKKNYRMALPFSALAGLVNKDGLVQIAGKVMKFSDEAVKIVNKHLEEATANKSGKVLAGWSDDKYVPYYAPSGYSARRWRVRRMFDDYNLGWNVSQSAFTYLFFCGVEVENQRDNWYGWGSVWLDGWEWGSGSASLTVYTNDASNFRDLQYVWPTSWGSSNGVQELNTERIFRGTAGFFNSNVGWGTYGIYANGSSSNMASYSFGRAEIKDPYNNNSTTFSFSVSR